MCFKGLNLTYHALFWPPARHNGEYWSIENQCMSTVFDSFYSQDEKSETFYNVSITKRKKGSAYTSSVLGSSFMTSLGTDIFVIDFLKNGVV